VVTTDELMGAAELSRRVMELGEMMLRTSVDDNEPVDDRVDELRRLAHVVRRRLIAIEDVIA
jgi:protein gp37